MPELTWRLRTADGRQITGAYLKLTPSARLHGGDPTAPVTVLPAPLFIPLDTVQSNGGDWHLALAATVAATDDPAYTPRGWVWHAELVGVPAAPRPFYFEAPAGPAVDLGEVVPVPDSDGNLVTRGPEGRGIQDMENTAEGWRIIFTDGTDQTVPWPAAAQPPVGVEVAPGVYELTGPGVAETAPGVYDIGGPRG